MYVHVRHLAGGNPGVVMIQVLRDPQPLYSLKKAGMPSIADPWYGFVTTAEFLFSTAAISDGCDAGGPDRVAGRLRSDSRSEGFFR